MLEKELESQGISPNLARQNDKSFKNANESQQLHTFKSLESLSEGDDSEITKGRMAKFKTVLDSQES